MGALSAKGNCGQRGSVALDTEGSSRRDSVSDPLPPCSVSSPGSAKSSPPTPAAALGASGA